MADISVDGGAPIRMTFPVAGRDFDTVGVIPLTVSLRAGSNSVAFANPSGFAPDLVALDVRPDPELRQITRRAAPDASATLLP